MAEKKRASREDILAVADLPVNMEKVKIPEWNMTVNVRTMGGNQRDDWEIRASKMRGGVDGVMALLAAFTVCDDKGDLLFKPEDVPELNKLPCTGLARIYDRAKRLNVLVESDILELVKNSESARS